MSLLRTKSIEQSIKDTDEPDHKLRKDLGALDLVVFGVGVIVGAGIFVLTGTVAASNSGPALALSFMIAAVACGLAGLCYAEFASTVPVAGSAYTFSYATLGELVAWIIGWDLVLEFTIGSAALSVSFSGYLQSLLDGTPLEVPTALASASDGFIDLPAVVIALRGDGHADPRHQVLQPGQPGRRRHQARGRGRGDRGRRSSTSTRPTGCRSSPSRSRSPTVAAGSSRPR